MKRNCSFLFPTQWKKLIKDLNKESCVWNLNVVKHKKTAHIFWALVHWVEMRCKGKRAEHTNQNKTNCSSFTHRSSGFFANQTSLVEADVSTHMNPGAPQSSCSDLVYQSLARLMSQAQFARALACYQSKGLIDSSTAWLLLMSNEKSISETSIWMNSTRITALQSEELIWLICSFNSLQKTKTESKGRNSSQLLTSQIWSFPFANSQLVIIILPLHYFKLISVPKWWFSSSFATFSQNEIFPLKLIDILIKKIVPFVSFFPSEIYESFYSQLARLSKKWKFWH